MKSGYGEQGIVTVQAAGQPEGATRKPGRGNLSRPPYKFRAISLNLCAGLAGIIQSMKNSSACRSH
ncbi:hypothetical protein [Pseudoduganella lutea]|uniref:Uncharacterized protein n=1 Tax=Pseudoduganella lutea TaxID=321985 RepID=A0A4P6KWZ8_9BURK|nr:hypothetical protein [Pseudoduganella lutea]QBE63042.1 hypothetical protein EWM63_08690 [Pseudoduganella lutea]